MAMIEIEQDGVKRRTNGTFFRGENTNFFPRDTSLDRESVVDEYIMKGWKPAEPFLDQKSAVVAFGSCFASNISKYLDNKGYNVLTKKEGKAYVTRMGDGIVNTYAILQQFEWAWENRTPKSSLWHGYSAEDFGYDETVRLETKALFDAAECFIITLGLSEVWYDEPTGEVFWRAVPKDAYDPSRHKFRVTSVEENYGNLVKIYELIRKYRPDAAIVFTVSPIPLTATFRPISCVTANSVSKSILRVAVDQLFQKVKDKDPKIFYFPSYEVVTSFYNHQWLEDRRHVHPHVLRINMMIFERYFCHSELDDKSLFEAFQESVRNDKEVGLKILSGTAPVLPAREELKAKHKAERKAIKAARKAEAKAAKKEKRLAEKKVLKDAKKKEKKDKKDK